jgi:hypothetical protein
VIHPDIRENIHTVCDVPDNLQTVINEFSAKIPILDTSLLSKYEDKDEWYLYEL